MEESLTPGEMRLYSTRLWKLLDLATETLDRVQKETIQPSGSPPYLRDDEALEEVSLEREVELVAVEDELRERARTALQRIDEGTYGTCDNCGKQISRARLEIVPYALECADCARAREHEQARRSGGARGA